MSDEPEMTREEAEREADEQIAWSDETIKLFVQGLRQFVFFNPDTDRRTKISTVMSMLLDMSGQELDGNMLLAAVAIVTLADQEKAVVP